MIIKLYTLEYIIQIIIIYVYLVDIKHFMKYYKLDIILFYIETIF
jgi:hypothetical protein